MHRKETGVQDGPSLQEDECKRVGYLSWHTTASYTDPGDADY